ASGIAGFAEEYFPVVDFNLLGGFITKTITLKPRKGNTHTRLFEVKGGIINSIGLENPGVEAFLKQKLPLMKKILKIPIVVSIAGGSYREFCRLSKYFYGIAGVAALELNLSCPNTGSDVLICQNERQAVKITSAVKLLSGLPVIVKLSPAVADAVSLAGALKRAGADAISLINTFPTVIIEQKKIISGGFSGPGLKSTALKIIKAVAEKVKIDIMGVGGISSVSDAGEFFKAGAVTIAVGSAMFRDPLLPIKIVNEIMS
ncbi:MAG: HisA/HisF-related TIM barrel protein, partial [Elusimicrobiota bacterium]